MSTARFNFWQTTTGVNRQTILQVVSSTKTDVQSFAATLTFADITGLSVTITPTSTASRFLIFFSVVAANGTDGSHFYTRLQRNGTNILLADVSGNKTSGSGMIINTTGPGQVLTNSCMYIDSPNTLSSVTYKLQGASNNVGGVSWINRSTRDNDLAGYDGRSTSNITVLEIAA